MQSLLICLALSFGAMLRAEVNVRVVDRFTRLPITNSALALQKMVEGKPTLAQKFSASAQGFLKFNLPEDGRVYQFEVSAEDYLPFQSKQFTAATAPAFQDLALDRLNDFEGVVIAPTGQVAEGARCFLCTDVTEVTFRPDRTFFTRSREAGVTGPKGRFRLAPEPTAHSILVAHDLGIAVKPLIGFTNGTEIRLQPWMRVAGRMLVNGKPVANERLVLKAGEQALGGTRLTLMDFSAKTSAGGEFVFENVPCAQLYAYWQFAFPLWAWGTGLSHRTRIDIDVTKPAYFVLDFRGRNVSGRLLPQTNEISGVQSFRFMASLVSKPMLPALDSFHGHSDDSATSYALTMDDLLRFKGAAIPPGEYTLAIEGAPEAGSISALRMYHFEAKVVIPAGEGDLNLGEISARLKDR